MAIDSFRGNFDFLSNFFSVPVTYGGITYQNNEAAFQAQKVLTDEEKYQFVNLNASDAKRLGRRVKLRTNWEEVKDMCMNPIVLAKFEQILNNKKIVVTSYFITVAVVLIVITNFM